MFLAIGSTDMRKGINGLSLVVADRLSLDPFSGHLFAFCNQRRNRVKILFWDEMAFGSSRSSLKSICFDGHNLERRWPS